MCADTASWSDVGPAASARTMSRSDRMPSTCPSAPVTTTAPIWRSPSTRAASDNVRCGWIVTTSRPLVESMRETVMRPSFRVHPWRRAFAAVGSPAPGRPLHARSERPQPRPRGRVCAQSPERAMAGARLRRGARAADRTGGRPGGRSRKPPTCASQAMAASRHARARCPPRPVAKLRMNQTARKRHRPPVPQDLGQRQGGQPVARAPPPGGRRPAARRAGTRTGSPPPCSRRSPPRRRPWARRRHHA